MVSQGLKEAFPDDKKLLVLADSCSVDNTVAAFTEAGVDVPTVLRTVPPGQFGKGRAVRLILEAAVERGASVVLLVDADLESLRPDWVTRLATPVLYGVDLVEPLYLRNARDEAVTSHFSHPFVVALAGLNIRQPTGGELALSGDLARSMLEREWPDGAYRYGIDMFATLVAALNGSRIGCARLGVKVHRPNPAKLATIFCDVASTAMAMAVGSAFPLEGASEVSDVQVFGDHVKCEVPPGGIHVPSFLEVARSAWNECGANAETVLSADMRSHVSAALNHGHPSIDVGLWHECLAQGVCAARSGCEPRAVAGVLMSPFIARAATFWEEAEGHQPAEIEHAILADALRFRGILRATPGAYIGEDAPVQSRSTKELSPRAAAKKTSRKAKN
jgi:hypothetical protein